MLSHNWTRRYAETFFAAYFFYYAGYCVFSSYIVSYLTELGYSASLCGVISSLALVANLLMEPVGGYITDTFFSVRRYLVLCIAVIVALCAVCTIVSDTPWLCVTLLTLTAGVAYPFSQLMDAWVNCSKSVDPTLVYSGIRAGGSIGFAVSSILAGYYFDAFGWDTYFLVQAVMFLCMVPFLLRLPVVELGNRRVKEQTAHSLTLGESFGVLLCNDKYMLSLLICTVYWFSHRPVGSYLALIINDRGGDAGTDSVFIFHEVIAGGGGASSKADGLSGVQVNMTNTSNMPIEATEMEFTKILARKYELKADTGGAGEMRGGLGIERELEMLQDEVLYTGLGDRHKFHPWGLNGGQEGGSGAFYRVAKEDGSVTRMGHKTTSLPLKKGDVIRVVTPGAGGYGDPMKRPAEKVLQDVIESKVSLEAARDQYGVVILPEGVGYRVDEQATARLRECVARK